MEEKLFTGEVFHPSRWTLNKSNLKDRSIWDEKANHDYLGFREEFARERTGFVPGTKCLTTVTSLFTSGLPVAPSIFRIIASIGT